jgi:hypothetical protein
MSNYIYKTNMTMYSLSDFANISNRGFDVILPNATVILINELSKLVGSPNYIKTPVFTKRETTVDVDKKRRRQRNRPLDSSDGWSPASSSKVFKKVSAESDIGANIVFNPTGSLIKKGGADATPIQLIRPMLNKFGGNATNQHIKEELFSVLSDIFESDITQEELTKLTVQIIDIVSGNLFYSAIYAKLFSEIMETHPIFTDTLDMQYSNYLTSYTDIRSIDPKEDYDLFCTMNKTNDRRKSITSFYVHLYKLGKITHCSILGTIKTLVGMIRDNINNIESSQLVGEIIENVFIFLDPSSDLFCMARDVIIHPTSDTEDDELSVCICDYIIQLSETTQKIYPGLNTKSLFKLKDLVDNCTKAS